VHSPVPSSEIIDALTHIRDLFRRTRPSNERELRESERREAATKDLLSNLPRTNEHPTLRTLLEIADIFSLTLQGAHSLFGYSLEDIRDYDLHLNCGRTHIFESYPFDRDLSIDLPARLAPAGAFAVDALLRDLVLEWQTGIPVRALEEAGWEQPDTYYVSVGTEDSLGSSIPPGAMALVEPVGENERALPNPRSIYLLQFANGYRCSHCVVTRGKLRLFSTGKVYLGREEFAYPGSVRIAGRIRMFAMSLPLPEYPVPVSLPPRVGSADLVLPWEHPTRDRLFATKHRRFKRAKEEELFVHEFLRDQLHARLSGRSERRYRRPTSSDPHVNALIHLALAHVARYTDALRTGSSWRSDRGRFSLETLLRSRSFEEAWAVHGNASSPTPSEVWEARRKEFGSWPPLLSMRFPQLRKWENRVVRLAHGSQIAGLDPMLGPGSLLLVDDSPAMPDLPSERTKSGWSRPIYVLRRGLEFICGYLDKSGSQYAVLSAANGGVKASFRVEDLGQLSRVTGVAVPV
jgi:hypothetical protein